MKKQAIIKLAEKTDIYISTAECILRFCILQHDKPTPVYWKFKNYAAALEAIPKAIALQRSSIK